MNPYKILGVSRNAAKTEILLAATNVMRERKFTSKEVSLAQKKLMNPASKTLHDFLYFIDLDPEPLDAAFTPSAPDPDQELIYLSFPESDQ